MAGLADVDGFKIYMQVWVFLAFPSLTLAEPTTAFSRLCSP